MHHLELFGLSTNIIHIKGGMKEFERILSNHPEYYDPPKRKLWEFYLKYNKGADYNPQQCNRFCAYRDICKHGTNILSTAKPKRGNMERIDNYTETYYPIEEVQKDLSDKLECVINAGDKRWHILQYAYKQS